MRRLQGTLRMGGERSHSRLIATGSNTGVFAQSNSPEPVSMPSAVEVVKADLISRTSTLTFDSQGQVPTGAEFAPVSTAFHIRLVAY